MPAKLTFGFLFDFRNPPEWRRPWETLYAETLDVVAETEALGFSQAWLPEHHLADDGYLPSPLIVLAALAARTRRLRLGTGVALAPLYHPVRFAQDTALLDVLSGGRIDLGLAIGYRKRESTAFGADFTRRGARFDEFLQIVTRLWAGETVDFIGNHFQIAGARLSPPAPHGRVPLYIGGFADKALERVARYGQGYVGAPGVCGAYLEKLREQGKDPAAARIVVTELTTMVASDPGAAMEELAPHFLHANNSYGSWFAEDRALGMEGMTPKTLNQYKASGDLQVLDPQAAIAHFRAMQAQMPVEHVILPMPAGLSPERFLHYARVFARDVLPAFA